MKRLILILTLIIPSHGFSATGSGNVSSVNTLGGAVGSGGFNVPLSDMSNMTSLVMGSDSVTSGNFYNFSSMNGTTQSAYVVPAGKTFYAYGWYSYGANSTGAYELGFSDNPPSENGSTAPLNAIYFAPTNATTNAPFAMGNSAATTNVWYWMPIPFQVQAGKSLFIRPIFSSAAMKVVVIGRTQ